MLQKLYTLLGQVVNQVYNLINQSNIADKNQLVNLLVQLLVQVKVNSKYHTQLLKLAVTILDVLRLLHKSDYRASELNDLLNFGELKDLKRYILSPLIRMGYISMTIPEKPNSRNQAYKLTESGHSLFAAV